MGFIRAVIEKDVKNCGGVFLRAVEDEIKKNENRGGVYPRRGGKKNEKEEGTRRGNFLLGCTATNGD